ncbi:hypothetical protein [Nitrosomonas sp. ANs5]|uniref:hypothetical protein n=1 Tax=Nitrosomonas sp. ANs5 TaxID=3423941 RepID=UPI003D34475A
MDRYEKNICLYTIFSRTHEVQGKPASALWCLNPPCARGLLLLTQAIRRETVDQAFAANIFQTCLTPQPLSKNPASKSLTDKLTP